MKVISENLGQIKQVQENESLPIQYVEEIIEPSVLYGRMMGLMAEISERTDKPITFDDEILKKDNIMLHAFLRVAKVITKEEQRVLNALMDELKWSQENIETDSSNDVLRSLHFVQGWKLEANEIFEKGGNMYDLLVFSDRKFVTDCTGKTLIYGYRGKLPEVKRYTSMTLYESKIAVARDFAVVLKQNDWELELLGHNPDFRQLCRTTRRRFVKLTAGFDGYMGLTDNGQVIPGPRAREFETGHLVSQLTDVVDVAACEGHIVALHCDGTVTCIDEPGTYEGPQPFAEDVHGWHDIQQVACGFDYVIGLRNDGTFVSCGQHYHRPSWQNVVYFDTFQCYYGRPYTIAILSDGSIVSDWTDEVRNWHDVVKVRVGNNGYAVGLKSDGTAYAIGSEDFISAVKGWRGILDIECKFNTAVAILNDGHFVYTNG